MKENWSRIKKFPDRLLNFLFSVTGIPWAMKLVSGLLIRRNKYFAAAVCETFLSLSGIALLVWVTHDVWGSGEKLRITTVVLGILLAVMKYLVALKEKYDALVKDVPLAGNLS
jgi:peptidoglycan biosynthesis protein MviN/MurJ (putative lipid II flippase)